MPQSKRLAVCSPPGGSQRTAAAALGAVALAELAGGLFLLVLRTRDPAAGPLLAPAGLVLVLAALVQTRLTVAGWRSGRLAAGQPLARRAYWQWLASGALAAYLVALVVGPRPSLAWAWLATVCAWHTVLLLPLAAPHSVLETWRRLIQGRGARRAGGLVAATLLLAFACEGALRAGRLAREHWPPTPIDDPASPQATADDAGLDSGWAGLQTTRFRVAIVGGEAGGQDAYLRRLEAAVPGVHVTLLSGALGAAGDDHGPLVERLAACHPDLVLVALPVCQQLARAPRARSLFDWRQLELVCLFAGDNPAADDPPPVLETKGDLESRLRGLAPQLAACRTPIEGRMAERWEGVFAALDDVMAECRAAGLPLAVIVVPAEFQVNRSLGHTLLRRQGWSTETFDAELPQRRLARFAAARDLPMIDLLPHLRLCRQAIYRPGTAALNDHGSAAAAAAIGGWLQSRYAGQIAAQLSRAP